MSFAGASAEDAAVKPFQADTEVETQFSSYLADITDQSSIMDTGSFTASLYSTDYYAASDINGLQPGTTVQVNKKVFTVSAVVPHEDGTVEIYPKEDFDGYIVFVPFGEVYTAIVNDRLAATYVADCRFMMPLPDTFRFCWIDASSGEVRSYDQSAFPTVVSGDYAPVLVRNNTVVQFSAGQLARLIYSDLPIQDPTEAVRQTALADKSPNYGSAGNTGSSDSVSSFTLQPIVWDGAGLGKAGVPSGYSLLTPEVHCGDSETCLAAPIRVRLVCDSDTTPVRFVFYATQAYIERVKTGYWRHQDWAVDGEMHIFMLRYHNAEQYSDMLASQLVDNPVFYRNEDTSFYNSMLAEHLREYQNEVTQGMNNLGIRINWTEVSAAHRTYTFDQNGTTYALCIMAEVRAYQSKSGGEVATVWFVPEYCFMTCPLSMYEQVHGNEFKIFLENTAVSDTFNHLSETLTAQLAQAIKNKWASDIAASNAYAAAMNAFMERSVNDYLYSSNYSASERFSDYIFDRNEYTTSDGYSVSISTGYDYVWEGSGGTVFYSNNALDVPYGASMLTPR